MPDYVGQKLAAKPETIAKFITDSIYDIAKDNRNVNILFDEEGMNKDIKDYPDESTHYVWVNVVYRLVGQGRLTPMTANLLWVNALQAVAFEEVLLTEIKDGANFQPYR